MSARMDPRERILLAWSRLDEASYYDLLSIDRGADRAALQRAFHRFALAYHPDRHVELDDAMRDKARAVFQRGVEAYTVLRNERYASHYAERFAKGALRLTPEDMARLPVAHQAPARLRQAVQAGGETPGPALDARWAQALQGMADPLSRLVAAAVAWRSGQAGPAVMAAATATASAQGWRRPLLAWLGLHALWAEQVGQADLARQLRQRMDWVMEAGPVHPAAVRPAARSARPPAQTAD